MPTSYNLDINITEIANQYVAKYFTKNSDSLLKPAQIDAIVASLNDLFEEWINTLNRKEQLPLAILVIEQLVAVADRPLLEFDKNPDLTIAFNQLDNLYHSNDQEIAALAKTMMTYPLQFCRGLSSSGSDDCFNLRLFQKEKELPELTYLQKEEVKHFLSGFLLTISAAIKPPLKHELNVKSSICIIS